MNAFVHSIRRIAVLVILAIVVSACGAGANCPTGQQSICRTAGDCRCGAPCASQDDCSGLDACIFYEVSDSTGTHRSDTGVCVDALWVFNPPPPCVPLCRTTQLCVAWGDAPTACANTCTEGSECRSGCCLTLRDGSRACAPNSSYCRDNCEPPCSDNQSCVIVARQATCLANCTSDADCTAGCCVPLDSGSTSACIDDPAFCAPVNPGPCTVVDSCANIATTFTATADGAACGTYGAYEGSLRNVCQQSIECRACWWDPATQSYSACSVLGSVPPNRTVPLGTLQCADAELPMPPVKIRCIDEYSFQSGFDCLGSAPL